MRQAPNLRGGGACHISLPVVFPAHPPLAPSALRDQALCRPNLRARERSWYQGNTRPPLAPSPWGGRVTGCAVRPFSRPAGRGRRRPQAGAPRASPQTSAQKQTFARHAPLAGALPRGESLPSAAYGPRVHGTFMGFPTGDAGDRTHPSAYSCQSMNYPREYRTFNGV